MVRLRGARGFTTQERLKLLTGVRHALLSGYKRRRKRGVSYFRERKTKEFLEFLERVRRAKDTPEKVRAFLVSTGIYNEAGELTEPYRPVEVPAEAQS
jgi:hypothetical protein